MAVIWGGAKRCLKLVSVPKVQKNFRALMKFINFLLNSALIYMLPHVQIEQLQQRRMLDEVT